MTKSTVAERISETLEHQERSGRWLARQMGTTPAYVYRRLSGEVEITAKDAAQVAEILDVQVAAFFGDSA